jgi:cyanophycinase
MHRIIRFVAFALVLGTALSLHAQSRAAVPKGHLVVIGGGTIPDDVRARALALGGGAEAIVVVLPQASELPETGPEAVEVWKKAGAAQATALDVADGTAAIAAIKKATLIWFPGGDQTRFMKTMEGTGIPEAIRARYEQGATVAGTSAGAAVMARVMITGDDMDLQAITAKKTDTKPGLGLWPQVIVDQHFLKRQRHNRLLSCVLDHPDLVGVGIDEGTAAVVSGTAFEVIGKSSVVVIDARKATVTPTPLGEPITGRNVVVHVLKAGMTLDLGKW